MKEPWNRSPNLCPMLNWYLPEETWCHICSTEQEQEPELTSQSLDIYHLTSDLYTTYCTFRPLCYIVFKLYAGVNANGINIVYLLAPVGSLAFIFFFTKTFKEHWVIMIINIHLYITWNNFVGMEKFIVQIHESYSTELAL